MKNPFKNFNESINNIKILNRNILLKKKEIDICKKELDDLKFEKNVASFKWYDVKSKANFYDEIKNKKKMLKTKIEKLKKEIKNLEKEKVEETDKRNKFLLLTSSFIVTLVVIIAITIGSINAKNNPQSQTTTKLIETTSDIVTTESKTETTTESAMVSTIEFPTESTTKEIAKRETSEKAKKESPETTTSRSQKIVYGSKTGNHYHISGCRYANGAKMTIADAERKGWDPCAVCNRFFFKFCVNAL